MTDEAISEELRRFILVSIPSVPFLEALLLLYNKSEKWWDTATVARRLYISEKTASQLLFDLCAAGFVTEKDSLYCYRPNSDQLKNMVNQLAQVYAKNLVGITNLIHSQTSKRAQQFADAFKWRKG